MSINLQTADEWIFKTRNIIHYHRIQNSTHTDEDAIQRSPGCDDLFQRVMYAGNTQEDMQKVRTE